MMVQKLTRVIILLMFLLNLRKLVGSTVTIGKSSDDGSKSSKGGNIVDNVVPSVQDGMKVGGNIDPMTFLLVQFLNY
jgi:hypothetical protein